MSVQPTFKNQALHLVETVDAADASTPIDGKVNGEDTGDWTRIQTYGDTDTYMYPCIGPKAFVGGFRHTRYALNHPQEVLIFHHNNPVSQIENDSETKQWIVLWTDTNTDTWEMKLCTTYRTPSLRDARKLAATLLTNIARADVTEPNWRESIAEITRQVSTLSVRKYDSDHKQALTEYTPWREERDAIHQRGRYQWKQIKQRRQKLFEELKEQSTVAEEQGFHVREALPTTTEKTAELTDAFVSGDLTLEELESELETAWKNTDMIPFEESLTA